MSHLRFSVIFVGAWCLVASVAFFASSRVEPETSTNRNRALIYTPEDLRALRFEWEQFWNSDQPSHMSPYRVRGGVI